MSSEWKENVLFIKNESKMLLKIFSQQDFCFRSKMFGNYKSKSKNIILNRSFIEKQFPESRKRKDKERFRKTIKLMWEVQNENDRILVPSF